MPKYFQAALVVAAVTLLGGCCRDTIREMASLKDGIAPGAQQRAAHHTSSEHTPQSAKVERDDEDDEIN